MDTFYNLVTQIKLNDTETSTPYSLGVEIFNRHSHYWSDPNSKFLDPCCGIGMFIFLAIEKFNSGLREKIPDRNDRMSHILENMVYGCDIDQAKIKMCKALIRKRYGNFKNNIECADSLEKDFHMKFDICITNPPFQKTKNDGERSDQASNLWSAFWIKCLDITKDNGVTALITPTSWLSPSIDIKKGKIRLWDIFDKYDSYANVVDVAKHFPGTGSTFGYVIVNKAGNSGLKFSDNSPTTLGFLPKSNITGVLKELSKTNNLGGNFKINQENTKDLRVSIPMTITLAPSMIEILQPTTDYPSVGPVTKDTNKDGLYLYVHVSNQSEADSVKQRVLDCLDILKTHCRWSGYLNIQAVKMVSYP